MYLFLIDMVMVSWSHGIMVLLIPPWSPTCSGRQGGGMTWLLTYVHRYIHYTRQHGWMAGGHVTVYQGFHRCLMVDETNSLEKR